MIKTPPLLLSARFRRHEQTLLIASALSIALLSMLYALTSTATAFDLPAVLFVNASAIVLFAFVFVAVAWKGAVPALVCALGVVLMHNAIILPYYPPAGPVLPDFMFNNGNNGSGSGGERVQYSNNSNGPSAAVSAHVAVAMHFGLGLGMVAFSMALAYRPSLLFARNRPSDDHPVWSQYPVWRDDDGDNGNRGIQPAAAGAGYAEPVVPAKSLMDDRDRYLMWRYEYVLASIYGAPHLVRPDSLVPRSGTAFIRDKGSGLLVGKAKHSI